MEAVRQNGSAPLSAALRNGRRGFRNGTLAETAKMRNAENIMQSERSAEAAKRKKTTETDGTAALRRTSIRLRGAAGEPCTYYISQSYGSLSLSLSLYIYIYIHTYVYQYECCCITTFMSGVIMASLFATLFANNNNNNNNNAHIIMQQRARKDGLQDQQTVTTGTVQ